MPKQKIVTEYDTDTGNIYDTSGLPFMVGTGIVFEPYTAPEPSNKLNTIIKLKQAGFSAEEIMLLTANE